MTRTKNNPFLWLAACLLPGVLMACSGGEQAAESATPAVPPAQEAAAEEAAKRFDAAVADENWPLAKAQGDVLIAQYPDTAAAKRIAAQHEEAKVKAEGAREQAGLAALWTYQTEPAGGGSQLSASIYAKEDVDTDGSGTHPVRLIFRDHPDWGRSSYLVLQAGDFDCHGGCRVQVNIDDQPAKSMAALRPDTDDAIAMFIEDEKALWRMIDGAKTLTVEMPTRDVGKKKVEFLVGGLDRSKLPGWG